MFISFKLNLPILIFSDLKKKIFDRSLMVYTSHNINAIDPILIYLSNINQHKRDLGLKGLTCLILITLNLITFNYNRKISLTHHIIVITH